MTDNERTLNVQDSVLNLLAQVPEVVKLGLATPTPGCPTRHRPHLRGERQQPVRRHVLRGRHAPDGGVAPRPRCERWLSSQSVTTANVGTFIDGESIDWNELGLE